jgi:predicted metal-dependent peptidase
MHVALKHMTRRGDRNMIRWNIADDFVIDPILQECGFELPNGAHIDPKWDGMWAEKVYDLLPEDAGQNSTCDGDCKNCQSSIANGPPDPNVPKMMCPKMDPNGNGGVMDAPINLKDQAEKQQFEEAINIAVEQAAKTALMAGNMPGALKSFIDALGKTKVDWRNVLRDHLEMTMERDDRTWMRPNRRFTDWEVIMPGFDNSMEEPKIIFVADTSGSIGEKDLAYFATEVSAILSEFPTLETLVYYIDTKVYEPQTVCHEDLPLKLKPIGGGGTDFEDFFAKVPERHKGDDIKCYIFFTDLYTNSFGKNPGIPVLWLCHEKSKHDSEVPFGEIIPVTTD